MKFFRTILAVVSLLVFGASADAHVKLTYPTGGETFNAGDVVDIQWIIEIYHGDCDWDVYFSGDNGATWQPIVENQVVTSLHYNWTVPSTPTNQAVVRVVQDNVTPPVYDSWSGAMTIIGAPAAEGVPSGSPWTWGVLVAILAGAAVAIMRRKIVLAPARR